MLEQTPPITSSAAIHSLATVSSAKARKKGSLGSKDQIGSALPNNSTAAPKVKKRPSLQQPNGDADSLLDVTEALVAVYKSAAKLAIGQNDNLAGLQQASENMQGTTIAAANKSIDDQNNEYTKEQQALKEEQADAKTSRIESDIGYAVMAIMLVGTVASMLITGGATAVALPEEMDIEMTEMGGTEALEEAAPETETTTDSALEEGTTNETTANQNETTTADQASRESNESANQSAREESQSKLQKIASWLKTKGGAIAVNAAVTGATVVPDVMSSVTKFKISALQKEVAALQLATGQSAALMEETKAANTWYQQALQLQTTNATDFVGELENIYGAAGDALSMYKQIASMGFRPA